MNYALAIVPAALLAGFLEWLAFILSDALPRIDALAYVVLLNTLPSFVAGAIVFRVLAPRPLSHAPSRLRAHLARCALSYLAGLGLAAFCLVNWREPGFGLFAQLFIWPMFAIVGGVCDDAWRTRIS